MNSLPVPPPLAAPFAVSGNRSTLPLSSGGSYGAASLLQGFPPETSLPLSGGGVPPKREDMNALGYAASFPQYFFEAGGYYTYDPNVANAIGGYPYGAVLTYYNSSGGEVRKLRSMVPNNTYNFVTSPGVIGNYWEDVTPVVGVGRTMFEFFWNFSTEIPDGALQLNGQNLSGCNSPSSPYYDFYTEGKRLAAEGKLAKKTMAQYVSDISAYGECNAFVFDQNNDGTTQAGRMRIPTIKNFIQAGTPGNIHSAGLPNITGRINFAGGVFIDNATGAFVGDSTLNGQSKSNLSSANKTDDVLLNASRSNPIYGGATTVQPKSVELVPCIQYAKGVGNAGGGSTSGGITPGQASSIASQVVESGSFNCAGSYNHLGALQVSGVDVATVQGVSDAYLPSSGGWTATVSSGGVINQLSMVSSGGAVVARLSSVYVPPSSSPWAFASGTAAYRLEYSADNMVSGAFVYDPATSQWGSTITRWNGTEWIPGEYDDVYLNASLDANTGAITVQMGDNIDGDSIQFSGSGAIVETSSGTTSLDEPRICSVNVVASGGATSGGYVLSGTSYNIFDKLANGGGGGSGGITSAEAEQIASNVVMPVSGGLQSQITPPHTAFTGTSLGLAVASGAIVYNCASPLTALSIGSAAPGCNAAIFFTLANGAVVTPPGNVPLFGVSAYTPGSRYVMAVNGDMAVVAEAVGV